MTCGLSHSTPLLLSKAQVWRATVRGGWTDLEEHVVCCHGELAGVEHQAFSEQGEEAVTQHDLRFPPDQDIRTSKGSQSTPISSRPPFLW